MLFSRNKSGYTRVEIDCTVRYWKCAHMAPDLGLQCGTWLRRILRQRSVTNIRWPWVRCQSWYTVRYRRTQWLLCPGPFNDRWQFRPYETVCFAVFWLRFYSRSICVRRWLLRYFWISLPWIESQSDQSSRSRSCYTTYFRLTNGNGVFR